MKTSKNVLLEATLLLTLFSKDFLGAFPVRLLLLGQLISLRFNDGSLVAAATARGDRQGRNGKYENQRSDAGQAGQRFEKRI